MTDQILLNFLAFILDLNILVLVGDLGKELEFVVGKRQYNYVVTNWVSC